MVSKINKQEALKKLEAMRKEMADLETIINAPEAPANFNGHIIDYGYVGEYWYICNQNRVVKTSTTVRKLNLLQGCFIDEGSAIKQLNYRQQMQYARTAMANSWGNEEVDWTNQSQYKWCIELRGDELKVIKYITTFHKLHFRTQADASDFLASWHKAAIKSVITGG